MSVISHSVVTIMVNRRNLISKPLSLVVSLRGVSFWGLIFSLMPDSVGHFVFNMFGFVGTVVVRGVGRWDVNVGVRNHICFVMDLVSDFFILLVL